MPLIATQPIRIGSRLVDPGYELTADDLKGRNVDLMKRHGHVAWVDGPSESRKSASSGSRSRKSASSDD